MKLLANCQISISNRFLSHAGLVVVYRTFVHPPSLFSVRLDLTRRRMDVRWVVIRTDHVFCEEKTLLLHFRNNFACPMENWVNQV